MKFEKAKVMYLIGSEIKETEGYSFGFEHGDLKKEMYVYKSGNRWLTIDKDTGLVATNGSSRKQAVAYLLNIADLYADTVTTYEYMKKKEHFAELLWDKMLEGRVEKRGLSVITPESIAEWAEDKELKVVQLEGGYNPERNPIWVLGPSKKYKDELAEMGFKWGKHKKLGKGWHYDLARK